MNKYRTAMGKSLDMATLRARNQNVRAVGNMNVDAAGNTLDSNNQVISDASKRVNQIYGKTTVNPGAVVKGRALPPGARNTGRQPGQSPLQYKLEQEALARKQSQEVDEAVQPQNILQPPPPPAPVSPPPPPEPATPPPVVSQIAAPRPDPRTTPKQQPKSPLADPEPIIQIDDSPSQKEIMEMEEWDEELPEKPAPERSKKR